MNRRLFLAASLLSIAGISLPLQALGCSCVGTRPPLESLASAQAVFRGKVVLNQPDGTSYNRIGFQVSQTWKGLSQPLKTVATPNNGAACGVTFVVGQEYVVYQESVTDVYLCDRIRHLSEASADLQALGPGRVPEVAPLSDHLRHAQAAGSWFNPARSGEGLVVEVLSADLAVVYWFGYRPDNPQAQGWLYGVGQFNGIRLTVAALQPVGGGFGAAYNPQAVQLLSWGSLTLDFTGNDSAQLRWNSTLPGYGSGELSLQRLTRPPPVIPAP